MLTRSLILLLPLVAFAIGCGDSDSTAPDENDGPEGTYTLVQLGGKSLPADVWGCCVTLSGSLRLEDGRYDISDTQRNKNNGIQFTVTEQGTYSIAGTTITFVRTGGDPFPFLLAPGTVSGRIITVKMGGEGPGSPDQQEAVYRR